MYFAAEAAVVGVIASLAVFFAYHVFWPAGFTGAIDWVSVSIALGAAIALLQFKRNIIHVLAASAAIGCLANFVLA